LGTALLAVRGAERAGDREFGHVASYFEALRPNGSRLSCGRPARRRKSSGR
jgi:hypothetical protein